MYSSPDRPSRARGGFTLVELMIALTVGGLVATMVLSAMMQQGRLARLQGSSEEAQQNVRAAIELLASELRSVPREGLIHAGTSRMIVRVPVAIGLLCTDPVPDAGTLHMLVSSRAWTRTTPDTLSIATQFALETTAVDSAGFVPDFTTMTPIQVAMVSGTSAACNALRPSGDTRVLALTPIPSSTKYSTEMRAALAAGEIYLFDRVEYTIGSSTVPGQWINRTARGSTRPLAGPLPASGAPGLRFRYFAGETELSALPVTDPALLDELTHIEIDVSATGGPRATQTRRLVTQVYLRNSGGT
jgi:prepilin-type N-terminal cleavage/methylation domain-containing protein